MEIPYRIIRNKLQTEFPDLVFSKDYTKTWNEENEKVYQFKFDFSPIPYMSIICFVLRDGSNLNDLIKEIYRIIGKD